MKDNAKTVLSYAGAGLSALAGALSVNEIAQIVLLIVGILGGLVTLGLNVWKAVDKYKEAKKDGEITTEEKEEIEKEIADAMARIEKLADDAKTLKDSLKGEGGESDG